MTTYRALTMEPGLMKYKKTIEAVPEEVNLEMSFKLFALMNLAWDYVDTLCDLCIAERFTDTKPLVRRIRELKRDYDKFRWRVMDENSERQEEERGLYIEDELKPDLKKLQYGLENEIAKLDLTSRSYNLVLATQQAMTLIDAALIYARRCDKVIHSYNVWISDCCLVLPQFMALCPIVPMFAGDCYQPNLSARKLSAGIIANRLQAMELPVMKAYKERKDKINDGK